MRKYSYCNPLEPERHRDKNGMEDMKESYLTFPVMFNPALSIHNVLSDDVAESVLREMWYLVDDNVAILGVDEIRYPSFLLSNEDDELIGALTVSSYYCSTEVFAAADAVKATGIRIGLYHQSGDSGMSKKEQEFIGNFARYCENRGMKLLSTLVLVDDGGMAYDAEYIV